MKLTPILAGFLLAAASAAFAETSPVDLRVTPERDKVFRSDNAEVTFDVQLHGGDVIADRHNPINLALVIDHSGSMQGAKMEKARQAADIAIDELHPGDYFSLVQFDHRIDVLIPAQPVEDKEQLKDIVDRIKARGSTALYAGVQEGANQLRRYFDEKNVNRIILVSDGIANVGPSRPEDMSNLGSTMREKGYPVATVGLGQDYNEDVMTSIAEASGGNYYYVQDAEKLPEVFEKELGEVSHAVAQDIRIIIEVPDGVEPIEIVGMPEVHFDGRKATIHFGSLYASQHRDIIVRCRLKSPKGDNADVAHAHIVYTTPGDGKDRAADGVANVKITDVQADSEKSVNTAVYTQDNLMQNAAARRRALALQDQGDLRGAAAVLKAQAGADKSVSAAAPASSGKFGAEAEALDSAADELESGQSFGNAQRKSFQYGTYNQANQKDEQ